MEIISSLGFLLIQTFVVDIRNKKCKSKELKVICSGERVQCRLVPDKWVMLIRKRNHEKC